MDDKYESFYKELQALLISRPVTPKEIADYVQFIATYDMEINAFIAIVNYCVARIVWQGCKRMPDGVLLKGAKQKIRLQPCEGVGKVATINEILNS